MEYRFKNTIYYILFLLLLNYSAFAQETFIDTIKFQEIENYPLDFVDTVDGFYLEKPDYQFDNPKVSIFSKNNINYLLASQQDKWMLYRLRASDHLDSVYCQQIDGTGANELVLKWMSQTGKSGPYKGSIHHANHLQIINMESAYVLFDEIISYNQEVWAKTPKANCQETIDEDCIKESYWENESCSYTVTIDSAQLDISNFEYELEQSQNGEIIRKTNSAAICTEFKKGVYQLDHNRFYWVRHPQKK